MCNSAQFNCGLLSKCVCVFNVPPTATHLMDWISQGLNSGPLGTRRVVYPLHHGGLICYKHVMSEQARKSLVSIVLSNAKGSLYICEGLDGGVWYSLIH